MNDESGVNSLAAHYFGDIRLLANPLDKQLSIIVVRRWGRFALRCRRCEAHRCLYVEKLAPGAYAPTNERYPLRCTVRNDKSALEITFDNGPDDPVKGAEFIAGLAKGGYLEYLDPVSRGDACLTVILGEDENAINHNLHVEVAGHDGKDHKEDAIAIARDVLAHLK